jgi:pimeloyl-ACP methyl ester carboxylesterase
VNKLLASVAVIVTAVSIFPAVRGQAFTRADAGGIKLRLMVAGKRNSAKPTVIFEAGAGGPLEAWMRIQPQVSKFARTISYDRAGNGLSHMGATPRDGRRIAMELHAALQSAHLPPPYVLVGHSLGGPYIRIFAGMYPHEVAGLVLIDPTQEDLITWAKTRDPKTVETRAPRPSDEVDCAPATFAQAREYPVPTNLPVIVITGLGPSVIPGFVTEEFRRTVQKDQDLFYPAKLKFHKDWVEQFPRGQLIVTTNSGHGIPFEEPELVIETIRTLLESGL